MSEEKPTMNDLLQRGRHKENAEGRRRPEGRGSQDGPPAQTPTQGMNEILRGRSRKEDNNDTSN